jgi:hypothetical protein
LLAPNPNWSDFAYIWYKLPLGSAALLAKKLSPTVVFYRYLKMKYMKTIYLFILCLLIINSCDLLNDEGLKLRVNNVSNTPIYMEWTTDTILDHLTNPIFYSQINKVEAHSIQKNYYGAPSTGLFDNKVDTLSVYIFDAQVLETTPWDTVKANYLVLKRYDLSLDDLNRLNWIITYP